MSIGSAVIHNATFWKTLLNDYSGKNTKQRVCESPTLWLTHPHKLLKQFGFPPVWSFHDNNDIWNSDQHYDNTETKNIDGNNNLIGGVKRCGCRKLKLR